MKFLEGLYNAIFSLDLVPKVLTAVGTIIGVCGQLLYTRKFSEWGKSTEEILKDLNDGKYISSNRRKRLQKEADDNLVLWKKEFPPPQNGQKISAWTRVDKDIYVRNIHTSDNDSACPTGDPKDKSTPIFFHLHSSEIEEVKTADNSERQKSVGLSAELENKFSELEKQHKLSKDLIQYSSVHDEMSAKVWILVPNFLVSKKDDAITLLNKFSEIIRRNIPGAKVILEIYLSGDLAEQLSNYVIKSDIEVNEQPVEKFALSDSAYYAFSRDKAIKTLSEGVVLGKLKIPSIHYVPKSSLIEHFSYIFDSTSLHPNSWTTISISGSPGTGKTELANIIIDKLKADLKVIVLVASTPKLLEEIQAFLTYSSTKEAFKALVSTIYNSSKEDQIIPEIEEGHLWYQAFTDVLYEILIKKKIPIIIVIDDLHAYANISATVGKLRQHFSHWGLRFVLISRTEVPGIPKEKLKVIKCNLWNRAEAYQILENWLPDRSRKEIEDLFEKDWSRGKSEFSLYLLRIITKHININNELISDLLRDEVNNLLSSVIKELQGHQLQESPVALLTKVREMLLENKQNSEILPVIEGKQFHIDPVLLFGELAWKSRYIYGVFLDKYNVPEYIPSYINDRQTAESLLEAGARAEIFKGKKGGSYDWHDTLVADVCATLYLGNEIMRLKKVENKLDEGADGYKTILEMISSLEKTNSTDFLGLALDVSILTRVIQIITNSRPDLAHIVDKFLTTEFISRLDSALINKIADGFWNMGGKVSPDKMKPLALALIKLFPSQEKLSARCQQAIEEGKANATFALAVKALQLQNNDNYFTEILEYAPGNVLPTIFEMAGRFWEATEISIINANLINPNNSFLDKKELQRIGSIICENKETADLFFMTADLITQVQKDTKLEPNVRILIEEYLRKIGGKSQFERQKFAVEIKYLEIKVRELAKQGLPLASVLVKWVAYFYCPDLVKKEDNWIIEKNGSWAIPKMPNEPLIISHIFEKLHECHPRFEVASLSEIRLKQCFSSEGVFELVRDKFPKGFDYDSPILPINLKIWDVPANKEDFISKDQLTTLKVAWRPRFNLS